MSKSTPVPRRRWYLGRTFLIAVAVVAGILAGHFFPSLGTALKPLADIFVSLIRMVIGPIVFLTIVTGISSAGDLKRAGRIGVSALVYFEVLTTFALGLGLLVANVLKPGDGLTVPNTAASAQSLAAAGADSPSASFVKALVDIFPDNALKAFVGGNLLQIIVFSILFGCALSMMRERGKPIEDFFERLSGVMFNIVRIVMIYAPVAAFAAMAFSVGKYGLGSLIALGKLVGYVYATMAFFVFVVLGVVTRCAGLNLWKLLRYFKEEIVLAIGTSSSETALPSAMSKLELLGCSKRVVGLVMPTGYSFNQDGSSIYLSMCVVFIAQVYGIHFSISQQLGILLLLMLTSKGVAGVTGSAFVVLSATIAATHIVPVEGIALLLAVERFMSMGRATLTLIGNVVATVVIGKSVREFNSATALECYRTHFDDTTVVKI
ncbi:cation:dicarboxylate symporter family transporter [Paraburkholderia sp. RL17-337-BIB-A]|uniref:cation:dicarboxylate symporter family transporter n=1 Tax=Paraburkholderia sp. RL17-337-BIB-A TaxID=3031636 RepID=UPI0038BBAF11